MVIDTDAMMKVVPTIGPRPNIRLTFLELIKKLKEDEEQLGKAYKPEMSLAIVDWWIGALFLSRAWIENRAAGGEDHPLALRR